MSDERFEDADLPGDSERESFAPLAASDLRGDEEFADEPAIPDEPAAPGTDYDKINANDEETS